MNAKKKISARSQSPLNKDTSLCKKQIVYNSFSRSISTKRKPIDQ